MWNIYIWQHHKCALRNVSSSQTPQMVSESCKSFCLATMSVRYEVPTQFWNLPPITPIFRGWGQICPPRGFKEPKKPEPNRVKTLWIERHWSNLDQPVRTVVPCNVLCCIVFYIALHWIELHWNALHCIALHCLGLRVMDVATVSPADINASLYTARNSTNLCVL